MPYDKIFSYARPWTSSAEKVAIQAATYNSTQKSLSVFAQSVNGINVTCVNLIVKDQNGTVITNASISNVLASGGGLATIKVNSNLSPGNYNVTLVTTKSSFTSSLLRVPVPERMTISKVYTNATQNAVFVDVASDCKVDIKMWRAYLIDANGKPLVVNGEIAAVNLSDVVLPADQSATWRINCTLASGKYTIQLITKGSNSFLSPSFIIP